MNLCEMKAFPSSSSSQRVWKICHVEMPVACFAVKCYGSLDKIIVRVCMLMSKFSNYTHDSSGNYEFDRKCFCFFVVYCCISMEIPICVINDSVDEFLCDNSKSRMIMSSYCWNEYEIAITNFRANCNHITIFAFFKV